MKNGNANQFIYGRLLPLIVWMGIIFLFSSMPGSGMQYYDWKMFIERKGAHIFEYFVLSILSLRCFLFVFKGNYLRAAWFASLFSFLYAVSDEIHQLFVFGRSGKITDIGFDLAGIVLGVVVWKWLVIRNK